MLAGIECMEEKQTREEKGKEFCIFDLLFHLVFFVPREGKEKYMHNYNQYL